MKKDSDTGFLINEPKYKAGEGRPKLLRIEFTKEFTKVDFGFQTTDFYDSGGWVKISKDTFIRIKSSGEKLTLINAENIPISPNKHHFKTTKDWLYYSLYFPSIELKSGKLDLIEADPGEPTDFNYSDIEIDKKKAIQII
jgi:hypothetical protein